LFERLFLEEKSIFVPNKVDVVRVNLVLLHAGTEKPLNVAKVGRLGKAEAPAVLHKFGECLR
jgi:hypothetical protein